VRQYKQQGNYNDFYEGRTLVFLSLLSISNIFFLVYIRGFKKIEGGWVMTVLYIIVERVGLWT